MKKQYNEKEYYKQDYEFSDIPDDSRFLTAKKEGVIALSIWVVFTVITLGVAYFMGAGDPTEYTYILGIPLWLFAVVICVLLCLVTVAFVTNKVFTNISMLDEDVQEERDISIKVNNK